MYVLYTTTIQQEERDTGLRYIQELSEFAIVCFSFKGMGQRVPKGVP